MNEWRALTLIAEAFIQTFKIDALPYHEEELDKAAL